MTADYINKEIENNIETLVWQKLQIQEILNKLLARYYDLETKIEIWPENARNEAICNWIKNLDLIAKSL